MGMRELERVTYCRICMPVYHEPSPFHGKHSPKTVWIHGFHAKVQACMPSYETKIWIHTDHSPKCDIKCCGGWGFGQCKTKFAISSAI
jgi:hypothetical protein